MVAVAATPSSLSPPAVKHVVKGKDYDRPTLSYKALCHLFRAATSTFYPSIAIAGLENVPPPGSPTLLCFNHGNSLVDAAVVLSCTPRTVHLCAKDTLWQIPIWGRFVAGVGTIPVFRRSEHGSRATELNAAGMYAAVLGALAGGGMIGLAPEGTSKFSPSMSVPLRTGAVRIALESVRANVSRDPGYQVRLLPTGLTYVNREKFRSDVVVAYGEPLIIDSSCLPKESSGVDKEEEVVQKLVQSLTERLERVTLNFRDWETGDLALMAELVYDKPSEGGKERIGNDGHDLVRFVRDLRAWGRVLDSSSDCSDDVRTGDPRHGSDYDADIPSLRRALEDYRKVLDRYGISDEIVRSALCGVDSPPQNTRYLGIAVALNAMLCAFLLLPALPGLILWMPTAILIRQQERYLLSKGRTWVDSIAEMKMLNGFISVFVHLTVCLFFGWWKAAWLVIPYSFLAMRLYEEGMAMGRWAYGFWRLLLLSNAPKKSCIALRQLCFKALETHYSMFEAERRYPYPKCFATNAFGESIFSSLRRRRKDNWGEILRFKGCATLDYID